MPAKPLAVSALVLAAALSLSSCTALFGPTANDTLAGLQDHAVADGRLEHAQQLGAEIARVCGIREDGTVPDTCGTDPSDRSQNAPGWFAGLLADLREENHEESPSPEPPAAALRRLVNALDEAPKESADLLATQAVSLAGAARLVPDPSSVRLIAKRDGQSTATNSARALLAHEQATVYGLTQAQAFAAQDLRAVLDERIAQHRKLTAALAAVLEPTGSVPQPAAGYSFEGVPEPVDAATAESYIAGTGPASVAAWTDALGASVGNGPAEMETLPDAPAGTHGHTSWRIFLAAGAALAGA